MKLEVRSHMLFCHSLTNKFSFLGKLAGEYADVGQ
jgi:hypothetical protein